MFRRPLPDLSMEVRPGEAAWWRVAAGATLVVQDGRGRLLEPPRWLAEHVLQQPVLLEPGVPHRVERGGWIRLEALGGARLRIQASTGRQRTVGIASSRPITERAYR